MTTFGGPKGMIPPPPQRPPVGGITTPGFPSGPPSAAGPSSFKRPGVTGGNMYKMPPKKSYNPYAIPALPSYSYGMGVTQGRAY